ncbi:MAG: sensor histidine kinase [Thermanaeromonas sp.]|uniref:sensor histidine kinase n=1 Tax=Thermanaeromonas sp. TaxID=2003697 RepID=UPI00243DC412|nr:sensor histidine kinase [Thermanaeromonas sp.]MCG0277100.1 sensor histidine kinase [Thermanaeromonas sp.]
MLKGSFEDVLDRNWYLIFFIYGLAFFLMGFSIALQAKRPSTFRLGQHLRLLAGFGLLHGTAEWAYIFLTPGFLAGGREALKGAVLTGGHAVLIALSFAFLFAFGAELLASTWGRAGWGKKLAVLLFGVWLGIFFISQPNEASEIPGWLGYTEILVRYCLAFPGALLSSLGMILQRSELRGLRHPPLERSLIGASLAFGLYAFAGGLVVPPASFPPASFLNTSLMLRLGLPVQFLRAIAGLFMAYFIICSLEFYEVENRKKLENLRQRELLWLERERIRRDLHDGITQAIYGLVLGLDHALNLLEGNSGACRDKLKELKERAGEVINQLRGYLKNMEFPVELPGRAVALLEELLAGYMASTDQRLVFNVRGKQPRELDPVQREHLYYMATEILSNIRRHSRATLVHVELDLGSSGLRLLVKDNGVGFIPEANLSRGMGLVNLRERAALAGGWVEITSGLGKGTEVEVWIPYVASEK